MTDELRDQVARERQTETEIRKLDTSQVVEWIHGLEDGYADLELQVDRLRAELAERDAQEPVAYWDGMSDCVRVLPLAPKMRNNEALYRRPPSPRPAVPEGLTFAALRRANGERIGSSKFRRCEATWTPAHWMQATVGELGELANLMKKVDRGDLSLDEARADIAREFADVQTYLDIMALKLGIDLGDATVRKFNEVSERIGSLVRLSTAPTPPAEGEAHDQGPCAQCGAPETLRFRIDRLGGYICDTCADAEMQCPTAGDGREAWQPIESAPRDGRPKWLFQQTDEGPICVLGTTRKDGSWCAAFWTGHNWASGTIAPTRWRPAPLSPAPAAQEGE